MFDDKTIFYDDLTKNHPDVAYEGAAPEDADELDYVELSVRGKVIA